MLYIVLSQLLYSKHFRSAISSPLSFLDQTFTPPYTFTAAELRSTPPCMSMSMSMGMTPSPSPPYTFSPPPPPPGSAMGTLGERGPQLARRKRHSLADEGRRRSSVSTASALDR